MAEEREILIVAGEASADAHGAALVREARGLDPEVRFFGMAGARMREAGVEAVARAEDVSVVGLTEVLGAARAIRAAWKALLAAASERRPKLACLIDFPDFNLRLARRLKRLGTEVFYYISPQVWAWRRGRVRTIARTVKKMAVIFPFEVDFYRAHGVAAEFVGHPLVERVRPPADRESVRRRLGVPVGGTLVALLPGSRRSEIGRLLGPMVEAAEILRHRPGGARFVLPLAPSLDRRDLLPWVPPSSEIRVEAGGMDDPVGASDCAVVASGTATVETALLGTPMVIVYRLSPLSYFIGRILVRGVERFGMANLIAGEGVAPELLQGEVTGRRIAREAEALLSDPAARARQKEGFRKVRELLGPPGAGRRAAEALLRTYGEVSA